MAERTVSVTLRARIAEYQKGLSDAQRSTTNFAKEVERTKRVSDDSLKKVGTAATVAGGAIALGKAMSVSADFGKQISGVAAVSDASASQLKGLSDAALAAGASTKLAGVSATDAARAESELVKAGISVSDVLGGALMGSLSLASAGQLDFGKAAEISAQAMNMFNLSGKDVGDIADTLAAAANKSAADVGQLGEALRQGGLVASQMGLSFEETVGTLALFADNALIGSDAGTSLKTMLQRLTPQSNEAAQEMQRLGFSAFDAQGEFVGMEKLARELTDSFGGLTTEQRSAAFATIFGADAVRAATVLYTAGEEKLREYNLAVSTRARQPGWRPSRWTTWPATSRPLVAPSRRPSSRPAPRGTPCCASWSRPPPTLWLASRPCLVPCRARPLASPRSRAPASSWAAEQPWPCPRFRASQKALGEMGTAGQFVGRNLGKIGGIAGGLVVGVSLLSAAFGSATTKADELIATLTEGIDFSSVDSIQEGLGRVQAEVERLDKQWDQATSFKGLNEALQEGGLVAWARQLIGTSVAGDRARESVESLQAAQVRHNENLWTAVNTLGMTATEVEGLADKYGIGLKGAIGEVQPQLAAAKAETDALGVASSGASMAVAEMSETQKLMAEATRSVLDPLSAFGDALDEKKSVLRSFTDQQIASTGQSKETWEEFVANTKLSLSEYAAALEEQNENARNWHSNLVTVARTVGSDVALALFEMGEEGMHLTSEMANGTTADAKRMADALRDQTVIAGGGVITELERLFRSAAW
jgi:TP901 family phage tail tape measure protein